MPRNKKKHAGVYWFHSSRCICSSSLWIHEVSHTFTNDDAPFPARVVRALHHPIHILTRTHSHTTVSLPMREERYVLEHKRDPVVGRFVAYLVMECNLVTCSLERTHDSDPTPAIVSPISTPAKSEPLVLRGVGVVRSRPELFAVVRSRLDAESSGVVRSRSESFGVVRSRLVSESFGVVRSRSELFGVRVVRSSLRLQHILDDSERLRKNPNDSAWLCATSDNSRWLRKMLGGIILRSRFRNYRSRIGVDSGFLKILPITKCKPCEVLACGFRELRLLPDRLKRDLKSEFFFLFQWPPELQETS